ncbi:acyl-CoA N-acyltransferase [Setomelanomma holmii]|uniref:Acyl-CoA N-acyltransferase n=1 Tax=Setomelanomma holmii TaxID=210430 RepID=A0A9P4H311_9PLEO|nr:acyl-CoA N-acyltransferase [Setomelanomma holmii]
MSVEVEPYNPAWPSYFEQLKSQLETYLHGVSYLSIEHVGSTSVPGLAAKPIIDIDIIVTRDSVQPAIDALVSNGKFDYVGELGIADRHVVKDPNQDIRRNIYICVDGVAQTRNHLGVRNTLRANPALRDEYAQVKLDLAAKGTTILDYIEAKGAIVQKILAASGMLSPSELAVIQKANVKGEKFGAIRTERLLLREFVSDDADGYYELERLGTKDNARYQDWAPRTRKQARELVLENLKSQAVSPRRVWELVVLREGRMVGRVGARLAKSGDEEDDVKDEGQQMLHFDLWFSFLPAVQGQGFGTEAMIAFIDELVNRKSGEKVELEIECDPRNTGSWKLAERLGFEKYSLAEKAWESKGEWVDSLVYRKGV